MKITTIGKKDSIRFVLAFESEEQYFSYISTLETLQEVLERYGRTNEERKYLAEWLRNDINMIAGKIRILRADGQGIASLLSADEVTDLTSLMTAVSATILVCANEAIDKMNEER